MFENFGSLYKWMTLDSNIQKALFSKNAIIMGPSGSGVVWTTSVGSCGPDPGISVDFVNADFVSDIVPNITGKKKQSKNQHFTIIKQE